jgi:hypothetical protein
MGKNKNQVNHLRIMGDSPDKKRIQYSFSDKTIMQIAFLHEAAKNKSNKRIYQSDTLAKIIDDAYQISKIFS